VTQKSAKAAEYYKISVDQGNSYTQNNYVLSLKAARGVSQDLKK